ncbi:ParA family protein [Ancylobacter oerskovii]|uniref:ParA family protein n=1 Tax=Ancylobacter oerskovii TaxID=459519 RepID=A0ABW4Z5N9_9HYPH|nr:ParA family protein [Ancylobacter oerskovii]MBS7545555.1 ParA family protein [Ancylobacter oerskovii]
MKTIVVANQKGGVGKTTVSTHLAFYLRDQGKKVLFIDLDNQGNSSFTLKASASGSLAAELFRNSKPDVVAKEGITLLAADDSLVELERAKSEAIKHFVTAVNHLDNAFDYCVIDTAPTLGLRMVAALTVANFALCPIELENYSIQGIEKMLQTIFGVQQRHNPGLTFLGMLPNRFNSHSASQKENMMELLTSYAHLMITAKIGNRSSISDALGQGIPVWEIPKTAARDAGKEMKEVFNQVIDKTEAKP